MGSKGLKWVLVDPGKAKTRQSCRFEGVQRKLNKKYSKDYLDGPQMFKTGTSSVVPMANMLNTFPYKNRTEGQSPDVDNLDGARIVESFETRGGEHAQLHDRLHREMLEHRPRRRRQLQDLGARVRDADAARRELRDQDRGTKVAELDRLCDEVGLDTIETGAAIAILMDSGGMEWGDSEAAIALIKEIAEGTELRQDDRQRRRRDGKHRKHARVPTRRGQAIPAWDPRPLKATGITYAAGPMGADHTAGLIVNPGLVDPKEQAQASQECQLVNAVCDSSGFCQFLQPTLDDIRNYYGLLYGEEISREQIADQGWEILSGRVELQRSSQAGRTRTTICRLAAGRRGHRAGPLAEVRRGPGDDQPVEGALRGA